MALIRYLLQYRFHDMGELIRNEKKVPLSCDESMSGKTAVITGATSGIGLETARLFAENGADLICLNRDSVKSDKLKKELGDRFGCKIKTIQVDFSSVNQVKRATEELLNIEKPIDVLIHNAWCISYCQAYDRR